MKCSGTALPGAISLKPEDTGVRYAPSGRLASTVLGYFLAELLTQTQPTASALLLLFLFVGMGVVGFLDDFIKIRRQRNLGLNKTAKLIGQLVIDQRPAARRHGRGTSPGDLSWSRPVRFRNGHSRWRSRLWSRRSWSNPVGSSRCRSGPRRRCWPSTC